MFLKKELKRLKSAFSVAENKTVENGAEEFPLLLQCFRICTVVLNVGVDFIYIKRALALASFC